MTRRARVGFERDQWLCPLQSLSAIDRLRDGLICPGSGLESSGGFFGNNCDLRRAAGYDGGENEKRRILETIRFYQVKFHYEKRW